MKIITLLLAIAGLASAAHPTGIDSGPLWLDAVTGIALVWLLPASLRKLGMIFVLAVGSVCSIPAAPLFDCDFICDSAGASNQSVCAPVAGHISVQVDQGLGVAHVGYDAWNGTLLESIAFHFAGGLEYATSINVHSNGGTAVVWIPGPPVDIEAITVIARGIGGPDRTTSFTAEACCTPTPEPKGTAGAGLLILAAGVALVGRRMR